MVTSSAFYEFVSLTKHKANLRYIIPVLPQVKGFLTSPLFTAYLIYTSQEENLGLTSRAFQSEVMTINFKSTNGNYTVTVAWSTLLVLLYSD
ncbi:hypothetical protein EB796_009558 [Bugula neritina]|uniref:Uncharacterized protein n=1 Tax=Bugula neritina TaxID=10212 RepID=A0A7J7K1X1_BUGNE|nr:hypothetical protein EB796_009558 [Bugula neritina]